jgi:hypothetical protein
MPTFLARGITETVRWAVQEPLGGGHLAQDPSHGRLSEPLTAGPALWPATCAYAMTHIRRQTADAASCSLFGESK